MSTPASRALLAALLLCGSMLAPSEAGALALLVDEREVSSRHQNVFPPIDVTEVLVPDAPFAPFAVASGPPGDGDATARQSSSVTRSDGGLTMTAQAGGYADAWWIRLSGLEIDERASGRSIFSIQFRVHGEAAISLSGQVSGEQSAGSSVGLWLGDDRFSDELFSAGTFGTEGPIPFEFEAVLPAGDYLLYAEASASPPNSSGFGNDTSFSFRFTATDTVIPEPATLGLLASGLVLLGVGGRTR